MCSCFVFVFYLHTFIQNSSSSLLEVCVCVCVCVCVLVWSTPGQEAPPCGQIGQQDKLVWRRCPVWSHRPLVVLNPLKSVCSLVGCWNASHNLFYKPSRFNDCPQTLKLDGGFCPAAWKQKLWNRPTWPLRVHLCQKSNFLSLCATRHPVQIINILFIT